MDIYKVYKYILTKRFYNNIDIVRTCMLLLHNCNSDPDSIPSHEIFNRLASNPDKIILNKRMLKDSYPEFYDSIKDKIPSSKPLEIKFCDHIDTQEDWHNELEEQYNISDDNIEELHLGDIPDDNLEEKILVILEKRNEKRYRDKIKRLIRNHTDYILHEIFYLEDYIYSIYFEEYQNILLSYNCNSIKQLKIIASILGKTIPEDILVLCDWDRRNWLFLKNQEICIDPDTLAGYYITESLYDLYVNLNSMYQKYQLLNNFFEKHFGNIYINAQIHVLNININNINATKHLILMPCNTKNYDAGNYEEFLKEFVFVPEELYGYYTDSLNRKINFRDYFKYLELYPEHKKIIYHMTDFTNYIIFDDIMFCQEDLDIIEKYELETRFMIFCNNKLDLYK